MANQWFRMYAEFASDPKVQMLTEADQRRYIMVLCIRCNGDVTLQDEEVAFQLRVSNEEWAKTKAVLVEKNLLKSDNNPTAWDKRQYASDSSAERVRKHREVKRNGDVTLQKQPDNAVDSDTDTDKKEKPLVVSELTPCPHQEIISIFSEALPELPQVRVWNGAREKNLKARWAWVLSDLKRKEKQHDKSAGIEFFRRMFAYISKSDFLMGRKTEWSCSLPWIVEAENFAKIIEGNFEPKEAA